MIVILHWTMMWEINKMWGISEIITYSSFRTGVYICVCICAYDNNVNQYQYQINMWGLWWRWWNFWLNISTELCKRYKDSVQWISQLNSQILDQLVRMLITHLFWIVTTQNHLKLARTSLGINFAGSLVHTVLERIVLTRKKQIARRRAKSESFMRVKFSLLLCQSIWHVFLWAFNLKCEY
jgi:hypothetical protein